MTFHRAVVLLGALAASPALASASFECETTEGSGIVVIGNSAREESAPLDAAILTVGEQTWSTRDTPPQVRITAYDKTRTTLSLDLAGPGTDRLELRIRINPNDASTGTLTFRGQRHPVSCEFG